MGVRTPLLPARATQTSGSKVKKRTVEVTIVNKRTHRESADDLAERVTMSTRKLHFLVNGLSRWAVLAVKIL